LSVAGPPGRRIGKGTIVEASPLKVKISFAAKAVRLELSLEVEVKSRDIIRSIFWLTLGSGVCTGGYNLELGTLHAPGSGYLFFWVGVIMGVQ